MDKKELKAAKEVYKIAGEFFKIQRERGFNHGTREALNLKAALFDLDKATGFQLSATKTLASWGLIWKQ